MIIQYPLDYKYLSNVLFHSGLRYLFTRRLQAHPGCSKRGPKWNYKNTWKPLLSSLQYRVSLQCVVCTTLVHVRSKRRFNSHIHSQRRFIAGPSTTLTRLNSSFSGWSSSVLFISFYFLVFVPLGWQATALVRYSSSYIHTSEPGVAREQTPQWGKKAEKLASRTGIWGGERASTSRLASRTDFFRCFTLFFCLFPHYEAWSEANRE